MTRFSGFCLSSFFYHIWCDKISLNLVTLSLKVAPEKMPVCKFFLEGVCVKDVCPYLHVKVSEKAKLCPDFLKGHCARGVECNLKHEDTRKMRTKVNKKSTPPEKPARKSKPRIDKKDEAATAAEETKEPAEPKKMITTRY